MTIAIHSTEPVADNDKMTVALQPPVNRWALSSSAVLFGCGLTVLAIAATDLVTANINLSILYALPVLVAAHFKRRRILSTFLLACVGLTYFGYFIGPRPISADGHVLPLKEMLLDWRMLNRSLSVVALCAIAVVSAMQWRFRINLERRRADLQAVGADGRVYEEILRSFEQLTAVVLSIVIIMGVAIVDFVTPAQFNLPILYAIPLLICGWTQRRALLWGVVPVVLIFTYAGYIVGPSATLSSTGSTSLIRDTTAMRGEPMVILGTSLLRALPSLLTNRTLAACVTLAVALVLHCWIGFTTTHNSLPRHPRTQ